MTARAYINISYQYRLLLARRLTLLIYKLPNKKLRTQAEEMCSWKDEEKEIVINETPWTRDAYVVENVINFPISLLVNLFTREKSTL